MNWKDEIINAAERTLGYLVKTPVIHSWELGLTSPVAIKLEHLQHTGSFKPRGAFNTLLSECTPDSGIVAASGGNHGVAVAFAANKLGIPARIYVPEIAGASKINLIRKTGADLHIVKGFYAEAMEKAHEWEAETGSKQIHAYDTIATVCGQGTIAKEWLEQGLEADTILIAVGGGGLIAGMTAWFSKEKKIVAVEPEKSCALNAALSAGQPVDVKVSGVAVNALGAKRIGKICYDLACANNIESVLVSDAAIVESQKLLWSKHRQLVEPAGATALAALLSGSYQPKKNETVAILACGANIEPDPFLSN